MKKIRMIFSNLAVFIAISAVFSKELLSSAIIYYASPFPGAYCDYEYYYPTCDEGEGPQCTVYSEVDIMYVSKRVGGGPCNALHSRYH